MAPQEGVFWRLGGFPLVPGIENAAILGGAANCRVEGWTGDPEQSRYGCFLPDLTGLASDPSAANPPRRLYQLSDLPGQGVRRIFGF